MESEVDKRKKKHGSDSFFDDSVTESRESSRWSWNSRSSSEFSSPARSGWLIGKPSIFSENEVSNVNRKHLLNSQSFVDGDVLDKQGSKASELEMMKERFSKLLLGEDMSGSGRGVCSALALSNAITNLYATVFSQSWRLEPLPLEKKSMWQREMDWFLCVSDNIIEMIPSWQTLPDGNKVEIMSSRPRLDLAVNLPALRKLDNMLLEILDEFTETEFWYVDQGIAIGAPEEVKTGSFRKAMQRQEDKWWLPEPRVPHGGLSESTQKHLSQKLECASQILKAASAINSSALAEMDVPESYLETLPKDGKACLGDIMYRHITSEHFSPDCLLDCLNLTSEHAAVDIANRVESAIYAWMRRLRPKHPNQCSAKSSWEIVRDLMVNGDKRALLVVRAENLLISLKQRFPGLAQTSLDASKIHCNKDIGKSILESYSRVLEGLAFSIVARIKDVIYVDGLNKQSDKLSSVNIVSTQKAPVPFPVPVSDLPHGAPYASRNRDNKPASRGLGPKRVVVNYIGSGEKVKDSGFILKGSGLSPGSGSFSHRTSEGTPSYPSLESFSVDDETMVVPQAAVDRYYKYSTLR